MNVPWIEKNGRLASLAALFAMWAYLLSGVHTAYAQTATATLSGTVSDEKENAVPGASVALINNATGVRRTAAANDNGYFTVPLLPPGTYTVRIEKPGFAPLEARDVILNVGDERALRIQLKVASMAETVTVDANAETVRTDGSVSTVVDRHFVANMPLNGRSLQALIQLTPGVVLTPAISGDTATGSNQFNINGQRATSNYFTVDGLSANTGIAGGTGRFPGASGIGQSAGTTVLGGTNSLVSLDALQEFRIETSTFAPEFGRVSGGQISLVTRGGENQLHGSGSYYFRNEALDANDWFANANRQPKPKERQSFFSGVFGGPLKRDRIFFFASYEGLRLQQPRSQTVTVPTVATRQQAIPGLRPYLNALPLPNGQDFGNGIANFSATYSDPASFDVPAVRLDARVSDSLATFFRFSRAVSETDARTGSLSQITTLTAVNSTYTAGATWTASPRIVADVRFNWSRNNPSTFVDLDNFRGAIIPNMSDVFIAGRDSGNAQSSFVGLGFGGWTWGPGNEDVQRQFNVVSTLNWSLGAHQLKVGIDYRRLLPLIGGHGQINAQSLVLSNVQQSQSGVISTFGIGAGDVVPREVIIPQLSAFAQDTWRLTQRLTITYGLRLERFLPPDESTGRLPRTLLGIDTDPLQNPRLAPEGTLLFRSRFGYFAPRLGMAYQLGRRPGWLTTVRGGTGVSYDSDLGEIANAFSDTYPYVAVKRLSNVSFASLNTITPPALGVNPPDTFRVLDPDLRMPYSVQWNATVEQEVARDQHVTVAYVGSIGRRLLAKQIYFQPVAEWPTTSTAINIQRNSSRSNYDALQVKFDRRLSHGIQALASYTFGLSNDDISSVSGTIPPPKSGNLLDQNFGPSDYDVRHLMSAAVSYDVAKVSKPGFLRALANGWGTDLMIRYQSALPVTLVVAGLFIDKQFFATRPDIVPGQALYINDSSAPGGRRFNRAAFTPAAPNQQGNAPRNGLRGFPASQLDLAVRRELGLWEQVRLQMRAELFNVFNHPNFSLPSNGLSDGNFGKSTSMLNQTLGGLNPLYQIGGPRSAQLTIKVIF